MTRRIFLFSAVALPAAIVFWATRWPGAWWCFLIVGPLILLGIHDLVQVRHTLLRIYPVIGHGRYFFEQVRPEIQQYFVESNLDGRPFNREYRSIIYQRAKAALDTMPFGTQRDVDRAGYEWMNHSLAPKPPVKQEPRVVVGGEDCTQPYAASHLNISAMSYGSLGRTAIRALNLGAKLGDFAHNTGEGGISPYHLRHVGDLVWQIGTAYFGCRDANGAFDPARFKEQAARDTVKMIEIKLSQGAKPGHGGILPAAKLTEEIAGIRHVPLGHDVISPPAHSAFDTPSGLLEFVARLRELSGGKPIGFKLCVGHRSEFLGICKAMLATGILPDFITVDGAEGGTGAAPVEFSNSVGVPMRDGLLFVSQALAGCGVRQRVRVIVAGKIATGFHLVRSLALGADICNAARSMLLALGCIQARSCHTNTCPAGITTQDPGRYRALDVEDKARRVARFHDATIQSFLELVGAAGLSDPREIGPEHILRRIDAFRIKDFCQLYPCLGHGCLLDDGSRPEAWRGDWKRASPDRW